MIETPYTPWMHSLLDRMKELYGKTNAKTIAEALPDGDFFKIQGSVATSDDLPSTGNRVGDIFIVSADGSEYIWVTNEDHPNGYWEKLGSTSVDVDDDYSTQSENPLQNKVITTTMMQIHFALENKVQKPTIVLLGSDASIEPEDNTIYKGDTLTSLTISNPPASGSYSIIFTSGSTATVLTVPNTLIMPDGFQVEANTRYEINVLDNHAVVGSWAVSA